MQQIFNNKKAYFNFDVVEKLEVGIALLGWEVKSIKAHAANFQDSFARFVAPASLELHNGIVPAWRTAPAVSKDLQGRVRQLLATKSQAARIGALSQQSGYTLVVLDGFITDRGLIKLSLGVVKGKRKFAKKEKIKKRDLDRSQQQDLKEMRH